jgi:hypothetical protein
MYLIFFALACTATFSLDANTAVVLLRTLFLFLPGELTLRLFQQSQIRISAFLERY